MEASCQIRAPTDLVPRKSYSVVSSQWIRKGLNATGGLDRIWVTYVDIWVTGYIKGNRRMYEQRILIEIKERWKPLENINLGERIIFKWISNR